MIVLCVSDSRLGRELKVGTIMKIGVADLVAQLARMSKNEQEAWLKEFKRLYPQYSLRPRKQPDDQLRP